MAYSGKQYIAINLPLKDKLLGRVEVDESYFGVKRHRDHHDELKRDSDTLKQPVLGVFERDDKMRPLHGYDPGTMSVGCYNFILRQRY